MKGQLEFDFQSPPERLTDECPVCGAELVTDDDGWRCPECLWSVYPDHEDEDKP